MASSEFFAFRVHADDNTAVVLEDVSAGAELRLRGDGPPLTLSAREKIISGHKIALSEIPCEDPVFRYGRVIGRATRAIACGEWVHLHNCASLLDERGNTLDPHTGAPTDTVYE